MKIAGSIIAGGLASRMNHREKLLLPLGAYRVIDVMLETIWPQVDILALNVRPESRPLYSSFEERGILLISDPFAGTIGPIGGIIGALDWLHTLSPEYELLATFPGDCPFPPVDLVAALRAEVVENEPECPVVAFDGERVQSLCALWPRRVLSRAHQFAEQRTSLSVRSLLAALGAEQCTVRNEFLNLNTPSDLALAEKRLSEHKNHAAVS